MKFASTLALAITLVGAPALAAKKDAPVAPQPPASSRNSASRSVPQPARFRPH